jgi:hypothetical protein
VDPRVSRTGAPPLSSRSSSVDTLARAFRERLTRAAQSSQLVSNRRSRRTDPRTDQAQPPIRSTPAQEPITTFNPFGPNEPNLLYSAPLPSEQSLRPTGRVTKSSTYESTELHDPAGVRHCLTTKVTVIKVEYEAPNRSRFWKVYSKTTTTDKQVVLTDNGLTPVVD